MRAPDLGPLRLRLRVAYALLLVAFLGLTARAAQLTLLAGRSAERGRSQLLSALELAPERGRIVDREGVDLALTVGVASVYAVPSEIPDRDATARRLAALLHLDAAALRERLAQRRPFVFVKRWVDEERADQVRALDLPGIGTVTEPRRAYPHGALAASMVGFANIDGQGVRGVEQMENEWLLGRPRRIAVERDARGRLLLGPGLDRHAAAGGDVALTLDLQFQADAEAALAEGIAAARAAGGFVVSLDPRTGDVLALAESPGFDPNHFRTVPFRDTRSRAFADAVEPGSTFKTFVIAAAIEAGAVESHEVFDLRGGLRVPGKTIRDLHPKPMLDVAGILRVSSNVGAVLVGQRVGARRHYETLQRFGFGARTGSGFPEESSGLLRHVDRWRPVDAATASFGQGISVTPVQLAAAMAAFGNGGIWMPPRLVRARRAPDGLWEALPLAGGRRAVSEDTAAAVMDMLAGVVHVEGGTGRRARLRGLAVAGKTGTAQKLEPNGRYSHERYIGWFVGLAPADDPRVAIAVAIDEPRGVHTGGAVAAPVFARVAAAHLTQLGIPTEPEWLDPSAPATRTAAGRARSAWPSGSSDGAHPAVAMQGDRVLVPDLRGLTVAEVVERTARTALKLELTGHGRAVTQEPVPGTIVTAGRERLRVRFAPGGGRG
ncbi:MAG TPA: penicillin-binding protein [Myxococcota bacterium]|nr:penicillin-binding protein [Myxococcota bacterium]